MAPSLPVTPFPPLRLVPASSSPADERWERPPPRLAPADVLDASASVALAASGVRIAFTGVFDACTAALLLGSAFDAVADYPLGPGLTHAIVDTVRASFDAAGLEALRAGSHELTRLGWTVLHAPLIPAVAAFHDGASADAPASRGDQ